MNTVCELNKCCGCMACTDICKKNAITIQDTLETYNALIDDDVCVECGCCKAICQKNNQVRCKKPIAWYQGWTDELTRSTSSSGGAAAALEKSFIQGGGIVCSCVFSAGEFVFEFSTKTEELTKYQGSKYVKSNPRGIYRAIKDIIKNNRVLFIGLPCQVAALKNYIGEKNCKELYTVDLICHGTPSPKLLQSSLQENNLNLLNLSTIQFRINNNFGLVCNGKRLEPNGVRDFYTIGFLKGLFYTENCYECDYAKLERVGDVTIGDSWSTSVEKTEHSKGVSVVLIQTEKGKQLVDNSGLKLFDVSIECEQEANHQLKSPFEMPKERQVFFETYKSTSSFKKALRKSFPKMCLRRDLKRMLKIIGILK